MNYAIIAAGEGSRLAKEGFSMPKPMVTLHGQMLIERLIGIFIQNDAESIRVIINESAPELEEFLNNFTAFPIQVIRQSTPSSLHSFHEILKSAGDLESLCLTTTDTVFREEEFRTFINEFQNSPRLDGLMAVTSFVDDESPLFVRVNDAGQITSFTDTNNGNTTFVSGGIYCLRKDALESVFDSVERGTSRMRNFQRQLLYKGLKLKAHEFSKIVDVDHVRDIETAEAFLSEEVTV
jgi:NDP-sugar pyrophosphorylase family protein